MKRILALLLLLALTGWAFAETAWNDAEVYRSIVLSTPFTEDTTYVIGHKSPDSDTVCSAIAYAAFLQALGIHAEARISAPVNRETAFGLETFGLDAPEILEDATGLQMVLVDHCESKQAIDGMEEATIRAIIDHHNYGDLTESGQVTLRSAPVGATGSLVYLCYKECAIDIPAEIAGMLLTAILSDTSGLTSSVTALDRAAVEELSILSGTEDWQTYYIGMDTAKCDVTGMTEEEILHNDYKEYEVGGYAFGISCVYIRGQEQLQPLCDRLQTAMDDLLSDSPLNMLFAMVQDKESKTQYLLCSGEHALRAAEYAEFGTLEGDRIFIEPPVSRKKVVVPGLSSILENIDLSSED